MRKYWLYFKHIMKHKRNIMIARKHLFGGQGYKLWVIALKHDIDKFRISKFIPYADHLFGNIDTPTPKYIMAHKQHKNMSKHHLEYWNSRKKIMDQDSVSDMIMNWYAEGIELKSSMQEIYLRRYKTLNIPHAVRMQIEDFMGLIDMYGGHTIQDAANKLTKDEFDAYFCFVINLYDIKDLYDILK